MTDTELRLIKSAIDGDRDAFERLIYKYDKHVLSIAYSYRFNSEDAKDIYQEVFMRVFKGIKSFECKSEFSTWLYRITVNVCLDYTHKKKKYAYEPIEQGMDDDCPDYSNRAELTDYDTAENILIGAETKKAISAAVESLPPQQRMVFTLKHVGDHKIREIADIMQCSEGTVKKYLFTAVHKLRTKLTKE